MPRRISGPCILGWARPRESTALRFNGRRDMYKYSTRPIFGRCIDLWKIENCDARSTNIGGSDQILEIGLDGLAKPLFIPGIDYLHSDWGAGFFWHSGKLGANALGHFEQRAGRTIAGPTDMGRVAESNQCVYHRNQRGYFDSIALFLALRPVQHIIYCI